MNGLQKNQNNEYTHLEKDLQLHSKYYQVPVEYGEGADKGRKGAGKDGKGAGQGGFGKDGIPDGKLIVTLVKVRIFSSTISP